MSALLHRFTCCENGRQMVGRIEPERLKISLPSVNQNLLYRVINPHSWRVISIFQSLAEKSLEIEAVSNFAQCLIRFCRVLIRFVKRKGSFKCIKSFLTVIGF